MSGASGPTAGLLRYCQPGLEGLGRLKPARTSRSRVTEKAVEPGAGPDARIAERLSELRFFGGLTVEETAVVLKVVPDTVMRDSRLAKAWLARELSGGKRRPPIS